jgi:tetratricopeptide (TPR) repeat protein
VSVPGTADKVLEQLAAGERPALGCARLYLNRTERNDCLHALEYGLIFDGQRDEDWHKVSESFAYLHEGSQGPIHGFSLHNLLTFDTDDPAVAAIWGEPLFDVPTLGLSRAPAGAIVIAARRHFETRVSINRVFFNDGMDREGEDALGYWYAALEAGDSMAHFGAGYTLVELGRHHEAYRHLRYYLEISPNNPWNWCWLGKAAQAIGEVEEARLAYSRAIELTEAGGDETDAPELLRTLESP